jgi:hypothetical protein
MLQPWMRRQRFVQRLLRGLAMAAPVGAEIQQHHSGAGIDLAARGRIG